MSFPVVDSLLTWVTEYFSAVSVELAIQCSKFYIYAHGYFSFLHLCIFNLYLTLFHSYPSVNECYMCIMSIWPLIFTSSTGFSFSSLSGFTLSFYLDSVVLIFVSYFRCNGIRRERWWGQEWREDLKFNYVHIRGTKGACFSTLRKCWCSHTLTHRHITHSILSHNTRECVTEGAKEWKRWV